MPRKTKAQVEAELLAQQEGTVEDTPMAENPVPNDALIEGEMSPEVSDENNESSDTPEDVSPLESTPQVDMVSDSEPLKEESAISSVPLYSVVQEPQDPSDSPEERSLPPEASAATEESKPEEKVTKPRRRATAKRPETEAEKLQAQRRSEFFHTDFKELDRDLSPEQLQEWQAIYASYRSQSILTGEVTGVDTNTFTVKNPETGETERRTIRSLVIIDYRVKVIIPETEIWAAGEQQVFYLDANLEFSEAIPCENDMADQVIRLEHEGEEAVCIQAETPEDGYTISLNNANFTQLPVVFFSDDETALDSVLFSYNGRALVDRRSLIPEDRLRQVAARYGAVGI